MRGSYGRYALVGALFCAVAAAWLNLRFLESREEQVAVVMVAREIEPYTPIPREALRIESMPKAAAPADALQTLDALDGHFSRALLVPDTVVRQAHLLPAGGSNLAARLAVEQAHHMRAMALEVNEATGVAGTLQEGDPVDVLVAVRAEGRQEDPAAPERQTEGTLARIIAQRVPVLYVQRNDDEGPATVVLQVTPREAEEIAFAQVNGMIWLLTSPYGEAGEPVATTGVDQRVFFERYGIEKGALPGEAPPAQTAGSISGTPGGS